MSHLMRSLLAAARGKAHLWVEHGLWHCQHRGLTAVGFTPLGAMLNVNRALDERERLARRDWSWTDRHAAFAARPDPVA